MKKNIGWYWLAISNCSNSGTASAMIRLVLGAGTSKTSGEDGGHVRALLLTVRGYIQNRFKVA